MSERDEATRTPEPYYSDDLVTLYHGDCEKILPALTADVVVTSPPYNMGLTPGGGGRGMYRPSESRKGGRFRAGYGPDGHDDAMPQGEYDAWQRRILGLCWAAIPDTGAIYYNHRVRIEHGRARLPLGMDFGGLPLRQVITWDRGTGIGVNRRHYAAVAEWVMLFAKPDWALPSHSASGAGDVWRLGMARDDHGHPAPFPEGLPAKVIEHNPGAVLLDPFCGSGTTLAVAARMGVRAVGIELSEAYCEQTVQRLAQSALPFGGAW